MQRHFIDRQGMAGNQKSNLFLKNERKENMSNVIKFDSHSFTVPGDGIGLSSDELSITFYLDSDMTVEEIEKLISGNTDTVNLYDDKGKEVVATYKGYTKFSSIQKIKDTLKEDGTTGTAIKVELYQPSVREAVAQNTADISAINDAIADLASAVGGE